MRPGAGDQLGGDEFDGVRWPVVVVVVVVGRRKCMATNVKEKQLDAEKEMISG